MSDPVPTTEHQVPALDITAQERSFINLVIRGINPQSAAQSLGLPAEEGLSLYQEPRIRDAIDYLKPMLDPSLYQTAQNITFTRDQATVLYLEAHKKAKDSTEEIKAVDSLVRLHGLAEPEKTQIQVTKSEQLKDLDDNELIELAGYDISLNPEDYQVNYDEEN